MLFIFSTPELIRNPWLLKTAVFLHWCLICALPFKFILYSGSTVVGHSTLNPKIGGSIPVTDTERENGEKKLTSDLVVETL
jgi:hypothetical protein